MRGALSWVLLCTVAAYLLFHTVVLAEDEVSDRENQIFGEEKDYGNDLLDAADEGRGKKKKDMMKMLMTVKMMLVSFLVPKIIGIALYASWKGITISMIAFTIAIMAALKHAQSSQSSEKSVQHIYVKKDPGNDQHHHEHWWRRIREAEPIYHHSDHQPSHHSDHHIDFHSSDIPYHGWDDRKR